MEYAALLVDKDNWISTDKFLNGESYDCKQVNLTHWISTDKFLNYNIDNNNIIAANWISTDKFLNRRRKKI